MKIAVYCGANSGADPAFLQAASKVGAWIAARGDTLIYGGGKLGLMGAQLRKVPLTMAVTSSASCRKYSPIAA